MYKNRSFVYYTAAVDVDVVIQLNFSYNNLSSIEIESSLFTLAYCIAAVHYSTAALTISTSSLKN